jgi:hypothetical protein
VFGLTFGCAHSHDKFYYSDGILCAVVKSTVFGTGETEKYVVSPCADLMYDTKDTGLSDNATDLGGKIAEGAVRGLVPGP